MCTANRIKTFCQALGLGMLLHAASAVAQEEPNRSSQYDYNSTQFISSTLSEKDYEWIGLRIYQNECSGQSKYLTHWGDGEEFPSFGIGHFIWFPKGTEPPFKETFPSMMEYVSKTHLPPLWLRQLKPLQAPWNTKQAFEQAWSKPELTTLRNWLDATKTQQARFIVEAFSHRWREEIEGLPLEERKQLEAKLEVLVSFREGMFSVIDYFNFKGIGVNLKEQYQGESWGLVSVLRQLPEVNEMPDSNEAKLRLFVDSAKQRLLLRTRLAPEERNESRWLKGWYKRLDGYLTE